MSELARNLVDLSLRRLAESLKCDEEYCKEGRQLVDEVGRKIADNTKFSVAERWVGGSVGKNTDVIAPDFDMVFPINGERPLFKDVLEDLYKILSLHQDELKIQSGSLREEKYIISFTFHNGIKVDLAPAWNLPLGEIRRLMLANKEDSRWYSSSLAEQAVAFMKAQDGFTHSVVRLGKFWFKSCHFGNTKFSGGSTIIELIFVAAAMKELKKKKECKSESRAMSRALDMIKDIHKMKVAFKKNSHGKWERIPGIILNRGNVSFEEWGICNDHILKRSVYLIEPANPLNDLLWDKSPELLADMRKYATVTKARLVRAERNSIIFENIFEPQPSNLKELFPTGFPSKVGIFMDHSYSNIYPNVEVKNENVLKGEHASKIVEALKGNLIWTVKASQAGFSLNDPRPASSFSSVQKLIQTNLHPIKLGGGFSSQNCDVVITVPFRAEGNIQAVRVEMSWI